MIPYEKELNKVQKELIAEYNPLALGIFGSCSQEIKNDSDVDMYLLKDKFFRIVKREKELVFEIYFGEPKVISDDISSKNISIIDRFRNSRVLYDPNKIYQKLINQAKNQHLIMEKWREKTILGGDYDLVERTSIRVEKAIEKDNLESAVSSLQYLFGRIIDLGFRRLNISEYANPKKIPDLILLLPNETSKLYKKIMFEDIRNKSKILKIMKEIEDSKEKLLPPHLI